MDRDEEYRLLELCRAGDARAFRNLLDHHYTYLFRVAYQLCGHRENAEDITQMVCMKVAQSIETFDGRSKFSSWAYMIVLNTFRDWNDKRANTGKGHVDIHDAAHRLESGSNPEADTMTRQRMGFLKSLPEPERAAIILVHGEGYSHKEAAEILGCAESTVSGRIHEARKKLNAAQGAQNHA